MPVELIASDVVPKIKRQSKIQKSQDYQDLVKALNQGIPSGKTIKLSFSPETKRLFKGDERKTAQAFVLKLRADYKNYRVRLIDGVVYVSKLEAK